MENKLNLTYTEKDGLLLPEHQHRGRFGEQRSARGQVRTGLDELPAQEP